MRGALPAGRLGDAPVTSVSAWGSAQIRSPPGGAGVADRRPGLLCSPLRKWLREPVFLSRFKGRADSAAMCGHRADVL